MKPSPILPELNHGIEFQNVSFGYDDGEDILRDISVRFERGKTYAIVGASGSGKSTLQNLMVGSSSNYTGAILYDGKNCGRSAVSPSFP